MEPSERARLEHLADLVGRQDAANRGIGPKLTDAELDELSRAIFSRPLSPPENVAPPSGAGGGTNLPMSQSPRVTTYAGGVAHAGRQTARTVFEAPREPLPPLTPAAAQALEALRRIHALAVLRTPTSPYARLAEIARVCEGVLRG